jgi:hypothetical protein
MAARGTGGEEKGGRRGPGFGAAWRENGGERWGPRHHGGQLERPASPPGRRAQVAPLLRDTEGGRARVADRRDRATSGPVGSNWVREGVSERERGSGGVRR